MTSRSIVPYGANELLLINYYKDIFLSTENCPTDPEKVAKETVQKLTTITKDASQPPHILLFPKKSIRYLSFQPQITLVLKSTQTSRACQNIVSSTCSYVAKRSPPAVFAQTSNTHPDRAITNFSLALTKPVGTAFPRSSPRLPSRH